MRFGRTISAFLMTAAWVAGGCSAPQARWPWEQNQVPVTAPKEQAQYSPPPQPATRPAEPPKVASLPPVAGGTLTSAAPSVRTVPAAAGPGSTVASGAPPARTAAAASSGGAAVPPARTIPVASTVPPTGTAPAAATNDPPAPAVPTAPLAAAMLPGPIRLEDLPVLPARVLQPTDPQPARPGPGPIAVVPPPLPRPSSPSGSSPGPAGPSAVPPPPGGTSARPEIVSTLGIQVNNKFITVEDILRSAAGPLAEIPRGFSEPAFRERAAEIISEAIGAQVEVAAVLPEAESKITDEETKKIDQEVDRRLRAMIDDAGGSRKKLEQTWVERGTTLDLALKEYRNRLVVMRYMQSKFDADIKITRRMLYDYYLRHKADRYSKGRKVQMQLLAEPFAVFLASDYPSGVEIARAKADARKEIDAADAAIRQGLDFTQAVKARSKGLKGAGGDGVYPLMEAGSFKEAKVEEAAFALAEGQVSGIIETANGFFLVKALKVEPGSTTSFEDAQEEIEDTLRDEQGRVLRNGYLSSKTGNRDFTTDRDAREARNKAVEKAVDRYWRK